jgi:hypothetical protein
VHNIDGEDLIGQYVTSFYHFPEGASHLSVYSLEGTRISFHSSIGEIDLGGNPPGMYILKFEINEKRFFTRIILL